MTTDREISDLYASVQRTEAASSFAASIAAHFGQSAVGIQADALARLLSIELAEQKLRLAKAQHEMTEAQLREAVIALDELAPRRATS